MWNNILIEKDVENFHRFKSKDLDLLLDRLGGSQFVLLYEASLSPSEFYRCRTGITNCLVKEKGFSI
jgi:erythromycin esterase-like protein